MNHKTIKLSLSSLSLAILSVTAHAQSTQPTGLAAAVQQAINNNPDVTARLNALRAAANEVDVARGQYLPSVDLSASVGRDNDRITSRTPASQSLSRTGLALSASQILWDGLATSKEVSRLGHARLTRYFEFLGATEETALEATRAYLDVERYRKLVSLAEDNYVQHKYAFDQLQTKFKAGVGRGVDAEQANARLALAESNLTTEQANLHDVSARYLRIVGDLPPASTAGVDNQLLSKGILSANVDTINQALAKHPSISAAIENLRAAQAQAQGAESRYQPTVEARVRTGVGKNFDGVQDQKRDSSAEILLNWNLFNGGSDKARVRQYADLLNQAADQRDRACRDVRQTVAIAHNDIRKLQDQLVALDRNVLAIEKARDAYRQQFDIGQRSLLDLLNAENELYTAKRSYANAESDLQLAYARTQAARHSLTSTLGLSREADGTQELVQDWQAADDAAQRCPVTAVDVKATSLSELDTRARKLAVPTLAPAPVVAAPPAPAPAATPAVSSVQQRLRDWADTWMAKDVDGYLNFYAKEFTPTRSTSAKWVQERRRLVSKTGPIELTLDNIQTQAVGDTVVTRFNQKYNSSNYKDASVKVLTWKQIDGKWVIIKESNR
ncbi:MAG: TolC family outer membrane protein [Aquabacterium sp.]|uniref:TolC family outer membrane protein n=1 Tax=Aquabacterium sp. TaxID=1872578 RepID=UPI002A35C1C3|nr:TolC family outer membrane protein [Aquabacterium sp.]MDX9843482.1 TolC family outer membrane protein [Aquabacterium sp.]